MATFGKKLRDCREAKGLSQSALAKNMGAHHSIIGRYERDEVKPTIDVVKKLALLLDTTSGYLMDEGDNIDVFKDQAMLKRLTDISSFSEDDKKCILYTIDAMIRDVKTRNAYI